MNLKELLAVLKSIAEKNSLKTPYICGGIPRDMLLDGLVNVSDIDITTGYEDVHILADLFAKHLKVEPKIFKDGHRKVTFDKYTIDFSTNFTYDNIDDLLTEIGIKTSDPLVKETYSRDFTINTLLLPLDFSKIIDITKMGAGDCSDKLIRCPLNPVTTLRASPNRIIRVFYYAAKYNLSISGELKEAIRSNTNIISEVSPKYAADKISQALDMRPELLDDLIELGVLHKLPLTTDISDKLIRQKRLLDVL